MCYVWGGVRINIPLICVADFYEILYLVSLVSVGCACSLRSGPIDNFCWFWEKESGNLWQYSIYATFWSIWLECNSRTLNDRFSAKLVLWDRIRSWSSTWCKAHSLFRELSLSNMLKILESYASLIVSYLASFYFCKEDLFSSYFVNFYLSSYQTNSSFIQNINHIWLTHLQKHGRICR